MSMIRMSLATLLFCIVGGCASPTRLNTTWKDPAAGPVNFKKVVVLVLNSSPGERRAQEEALAGQIKKATAVPSHTLIPDEELNNHKQAKEKIVQGGFDGAVVLRLLDSKKQTTYVPGSTNYWYDGWGYVPYQYNPGYIVTDTIVRAEVSLLSVPDGKLLWVGSSTTTNPETAREFALQIAKAAGDELRKQGLLQ